MSEIKINDSYIVECININNYGKGVAKVDGFLVFIDDFYPGEKAKIKITEKEKRFAYGEIIELLGKSPHRIEPVCHHSKLSGSCTFNDIDYEYEKELKLSMVKSNIERATGRSLDDIEMVGDTPIEGYRNKVTVFFKEENGEYIFGYFKEKSHEIVKIDSCIQINSAIIEVIKKLLSLLKEYNISIYDYETKKGLARGVSIRRSTKNQKISVMIISSDNNDAYSKIAFRLHEECVDVSGVSLNINNEDNTIVYTGKEYQLYGDNFIDEEVLGLTFRINNRSFLQVNTKASEVLYSEAIKMADLKKTDMVLDLYSGCGGISLNTAKYVKHVYGVESSKDASRLAKFNALNNKIDNVTFYCGDSKNYRKYIGNKKIDIVFVDPPREGLSEEVIECLIKDKFSKIIYVSCDSYTLARDLKKMTKEKYVINCTKCVNMFPKTKHVETVVCLAKK